MRRIALLPCLIICAALPLQAQLFPNRVYSEDKGLGQKFIFSIAQDTNGVLLLGTENGITAFNGDNFYPRGNVTGLAEKQASCVFSDSRGTTWVGHFQRGVSCVTRGLTIVVDSSENVRGRINSMAEDQRGNIWGVAEGKGLFRIESSTRTLTFPKGADITSGVVMMQDGQLLVAGTEGVVGFSILPGGEVEREFVLPETAGKRVVAIAEGTIGDAHYVFAAVEYEGIYSYELNGDQYEMRAFLGSDLRLQSKEFSALSCDQSGALWIGTIGEGITRVTFNSTGLPDRIDRFTHADGLADDNIKSLYADSENNIWLGTFGHGLIEIPYSVFHFYNQSNGLVRPEVNCVTQDETGVLWIGTDAGVTRFCGNLAGCTASAECSRHFGRKEGFLDVPVTCMVTDTAGMIWIGTENSGLFRLDPCTEKFENISEKYHLAARSINTLTITMEGNIMAGTTEGVYIYNQRDGNFSFLTTMEGLLHNDVRHLYTDHANSVWFSSEGTPPYAMHDEQFVVYQEIDQLKGFMINGVCEDYAGTRWIATEGDGVFAFDGTTFRQFTSANGLKSDNCMATITEDNGILWVVHKSGLSMKFPDDTTFRYFSSSDNRLLQELNAPVYRAIDGTIYFCSDNGLIEMPSKDKECLRRYPRISLARMFVNGYEKSLTTDLHLSAGTYNLSFEFNSILLSSAGFNPFYYRIIGADTTWRQSTDRSIIIPQLSSGDYTLQVSGEPPAKGENGRPYSIRIRIDYPFWEQTWFVTTIILLVPVLLLGGIRIRTVRLMRHNQLLHSMVKEKTYLLEAEKESVARMNTELKNKTKDITDSIHYAMRIQLAILPDMDILKNVFPESFIFYRPRDIVSGDFYWFAEKGDQLFMAVVDCTGHGVPGALMSMIGSTLMNKVVFDYRIDLPSGVLDVLNREIKLALHQHDSIDSSHDGMDIGLCVYDKRSRILRFSGAGRPLILIRDKEIHQYKTNKGGLGGVYSHKTQLFDEVDIIVQPGDVFYMFTDGYTDQFGIDERHKFSSPRFRKLLLDISPLSMAEQYEKLSDTFDAWKGDGEQCDDVLVAGFRII